MKGAIFLLIRGRLISGIGQHDAPTFLGYLSQKIQQYFTIGVSAEVVCVNNYYRGCEDDRKEKI